jgi:hypothetical protein
MYVICFNTIHETGLADRISSVITKVNCLLKSHIFIVSLNETNSGMEVERHAL